MYQGGRTMIHVNFIQQFLRIFQKVGGYGIRDGFLNGRI